jgi:hypothetical protein
VYCPSSGQASESLDSAASSPARACAARPSPGSDLASYTRIKVPRPHAGHHRSVFTLLAWNPLYEQITLGVILLLAVGGDAWSRLRTT